ncbi:MAG TPA: tripartite tricarboxylate transporter substrate binding protein [Ramlibacter sp.]|jgi:tripartite-type tricarboxylate transporter receptor subunit TctC|uniref:Bug family tripartite tricarboxylate transporter substrate binding protein n=1 Tax=Ramlibacter sp. TaxID=1917967 RepID=UPI002D52CACB|nr:tripartite tricarboxylate transporter substrate binding protein [Ramlibacter sp.]HZY19205.1 tripartite tricarboxylate transporter substrate binding protein [Ramlibacter sp.]
MKHQSIRRLMLVALAGAAILPAITPAAAQGNDSPLRVILPVGPGSGVDVTIRSVQNALSRELKQTVVIENLPGAGGITGTAQLVKAAPDGRTIAFVSNNHAVNPSIFKKMPYDNLADITPISVVAEAPFVLVVNPAKLPVNTAKELQAALKAKPDGYNFASSGNGTILHLATEMFVDAADVKAKHVPYRGVGPMLTDLMGGQVDFGVVAVPSVQGQLKSGALRAIAVMGDSRVPSLPNLPTMKEQGFPEVVVGGWFAAVGPKGLPAAEVNRLHTAIVNAFNAPDVKEAMVKQENIIRATSPEQAVVIFRNEQARYARIVQKADIRAE